MNRRPPRFTLTDTRLPYTTLVRSLSSAAVVSHALAAQPEGIRAVVTQDRTARGVRRVPARVFGDVAVGDEVATRAVEPAEIDAMVRSEEHTSELQSLMRISYAVFCLKKKKNNTTA